MARTKNERNGRLEEAMTNLLQNQALFVQSQATFHAQMRESERDMREIQRESAERFARIDATLGEHSRILEELQDALAGLPEAVRQKFGFQPPEPP